MLVGTLLVVTSWCVLTQGEAIKAQPARGDGTQASPESSGAIAEFKADAKDYSIRLDARPKEKLVLRDEPLSPLFHWGNPARTGEDGVIFVWLLDGRPEVIGSVFTYRIGNLIRRKHEYHSLAAGYRGQRVWAPRTAGVTFEPVPDAPTPAATTRLRLSQMKTLARDFSVRMQDQQGEKFQLRLLPQPLIRYEPQDKNILDGALFSFSLGTDPEAILLLESRVADGHAAWQYAFARFHYIDLVASFKDRQVWHAEALPEDIALLEIGSPNYQDSVYSTYHVKTTPVEE